MAPLRVVLSLAWGIFALVWLIGAFRVKPDASGERGWRAAYHRYFPRIFFAAILVAMIGLIVHRKDWQLLPPAMFRVGPLLSWIAAMATVAGTGLAIWARAHIGRNWSARPSCKEGHELVTSGPYRVIRHPIYTGVLLGVAGLCVAGRPIPILLLPLMLGVFVHRIFREERIMLELFPAQYPAYREQTWRLVPLVW